MKRKGMLAALAVAAAALAVAAYALAGGSGPGFNHLTETLQGYQEVPSTSTAGTAAFTADVAKDGQSIAWQMTYSGLESQVLQSHIHFGQRSVNGGISVFLCTNLGNGPAGTQACPQPTSGPVTISGTMAPADVSPNIAATAAARTQGINTGEWDELMRAIDAGKTYANIHTANLPTGEIRAQLHETGNPHD
ncbi:MAG: CHRD domain-containing protein [Gaiellaceae bacterium]